MSAICGQGELDQKIREKNETEISNFKETLHTLCKKIYSYLLLQKMSLQIINLYAMTTPQMKKHGQIKVNNLPPLKIKSYKKLKKTLQKMMPVTPSNNLKKATSFKNKL